MTKKDWIILAGFVVAPLGFFAAGVYYGPKVKKWYSKRQSETEPEIKIEPVEPEIKIEYKGYEIHSNKYKNGYSLSIHKPGESKYELAIRGWVQSKDIVESDGKKMIDNLIKNRN